MAAWEDDERAVSAKRGRRWERVLRAIVPETLLFKLAPERKVQVDSEPRAFRPRQTPRRHPPNRFAMAGSTSSKSSECLWGRNRFTPLRSNISTCQHPSEAHFWQLRRPNIPNSSIGFRWQGELESSAPAFRTFTNPEHEAPSGTCRHADVSTQRHHFGGLGHNQAETQASHFRLEKMSDAANHMASDDRGRRA